MRPATEGTLGELLDMLPAAALRDSLLVIVSTRPIHLAEEGERSNRLASPSGRKLLGRAIVLNAAAGDLTDLIQDVGEGSHGLLEQRITSAEQDRLTSQEERRRTVSSAEAGHPGR